MKTPLIALLVGLPFFAQAEEARYETVTLTLANTGGTNGLVSSEIAIAAYETGELVDTSPIDGFTWVDAIKDGAAPLNSLPASANPSGLGTTIRGPATFKLWFSANAGQAKSRYMTVKLTPVSYPPDKTIIVPPGTNQVQISLESSTNLVNWETTTNGVYGTPTMVQFFRIKETKLN